MYRILKGGKEKYVCLFVEDSWKDTQVMVTRVFSREGAGALLKKAGREFHYILFQSFWILNHVNSLIFQKIYRLS